MGAIGTIHANGDFDLALTIRTFAVAEGRIHLWVGGGIVWDSDPEAEIEESWVKARPLLPPSAASCPHDAARGRGRRPRARRSGEPGLPRRTTKRSCAAARRSRRSGSTAAGRSCSTAHLDRFARSAAALALPRRRPDASELAALVARRRAARSRAAALPDGARRSSPPPRRCPDGLEELRARGADARVGRHRRRRALLAGVKATSYAEAFARATRGGRRRRVLVTGERRARGADGEHLVAPRRSALHPVAGPGVLPGVTRAFVLELAAGDARGGRVPLAELLAADEAFTTSSIREVMPVVGRRRDDRRRRARPRGGSSAGRAQATLRAVSDPIRLGGMALGNGVLVHGPTAWACAIRTADGELKVVARRKRLRRRTRQNPLLRGPARLAEAFALIPQLKRALPEARAAARAPARARLDVGSAVLLQGLRRSSLRPVARELLTSLLSVAPAALALRGGELASYHGAEHISIGSYEHGGARPKEHERCGSHLIGPMLLTTAVGNLARGAGAGERAHTCQARGRRRRDRRVDGDLRLDGRHPEHPLSRALARPGHELQHRLGTREPSRRPARSRRGGAPCLSGARR